MNVLLVEDEKSLSNAVKRILEQQGYLVDAVYDGLSAIDFAKGMEYDLIILDVMLPKLDGFEVLRILRKDGMSVPILMLTARTSMHDKVSGLNTGADDYMTKPFDTEELLARVNALTRRKGTSIAVNDISFDDLTLDLNSAMLGCGERSVQLSKKEFDVMRMFLANPTQILTKDSLIAKIWGTESDATDNNVEVYISFIRKKLKYLKSHMTIKNTQRIGYRLEVQE
ncbi:MAG: response regulator transcription factor [Lachnospiraceae bacterium]|nr:response regulator transcription factor [Lachnospiraceae bacterium]